ncbi:MAG: hypothetical protein ACR2G3_02415 [Solirubrobacterales bacterium]
MVYRLRTQLAGEPDDLAVVAYAVPTPAGFGYLRFVMPPDELPEREADIHLIAQLADFGARAGSTP